MKPHVTLFRIPVRFDLSYLFLVLAFGYFFVRDREEQAGVLFALWVPIVTIAILLHELGHALIGRAFGLEPSIVLHGMGGLTQFPMRELRALSHGRRILITFAGPLFGIVIGAGLAVIPLATKIPPGSVAEAALQVATFTTLGWGILNLVPVLPLDGGHIVATLFEKLFGPARGIRFARFSSIGFAIALAALAAAVQSWFALVLLAAFVFLNWRAYRIERTWQSDQALAETIQEAYAALEAGDTGKVRRLADAVRDAAMTPVCSASAAHLLAWAHLIEGDAARARAALEEAPSEIHPDAFLEGSVYLACGEPSRAMGPLIEALVDRGDEEVADAVGEAAIATSGIDALLALLDSEERAQKVGQELFHRIGQKLSRRGHDANAIDLFARVFDRFGDAEDALCGARAAARAGVHSRALDLLEKAVRAGLEDPSVLDDDEDLEPLRGHPRFASLRS